MAEPHYWMAETSGVLQPAIEAYLAAATMAPEEIAALRAYLRQWIYSPIWDFNPHATAADVTELQRLREAIDELTDRASIETWLDAAADLGIDPL